MLNRLTFASALPAAEAFSSFNLIDFEVLTALKKNEDNPAISILKTKFKEAEEEFYLLRKTLHECNFQIVYFLVHSLQKLVSHAGCTRLNVILEEIDLHLDDRDFERAQHLIDRLIVEYRSTLELLEEVLAKAGESSSNLQSVGNS